MIETRVVVTRVERKAGGYVEIEFEHDRAYSNIDNAVEVSGMLRVVNGDGSSLPRVDDSISLQVTT